MLATELVSIAGRRVRVARLGTGPPLVLLHGYPDNLQVFARLAPRLALRFAVHAVDWPGLGGSEPWPGGATPAHQAERLVALLDGLGLARAALVAHDMGAPPALVAAARRPERVAWVAAGNALVLWDEATSWEIGILRRFGWNRVLLRRLPRLVFARAVRTSLAPGARLDRDVRADLWRAFRRPAVRGFVSRMCAGYQGTLPGLVAELPRIRAPLLALWGERDRHFPVAHGERLRALVPGSRLEVVPGGSHWMAWDAAPEVARRILDFAGAAGGG